MDTVKIRLLVFTHQLILTVSNKVPEERKIRAVELYLKGLSYRQIAEILEISHTTVWETVQKLAEAVYQPKLLAVRKQRNFIAVDKTVIKINGEKDISGPQLTLKAEKSSQSGLQQPEIGGLPGVLFWLF